MATPFTVFRKYAGVYMAVLCALLMFSFVILDPLTQYFGGGNSSGVSERARDAVATWRGGSVNELQLSEAVLHRRLLAEFQQQVYGLGTRDAQEAGAEDLPLRVRPLQLPISYEQGVERDVVQTKVYALRAAEAGMVVSNEMVLDYLRALGRDRVSTEQMRIIVGGLRAGHGRKATIDFMFELLREAILSRNYLKSYQYTFGTVLPAERYEDWLLVNDRIVVEAAPVLVDDYVDLVDEPADEELMAFFDEHRERAPTPDILREYGDVELPSPLPAFATPERVRLQYVVTKFDDFATRLEPEVTDEEIAKYYEENKENFVEADRTLFGDDDLFEKDDDKGGAAEDASDTTGDEAQAADQAAATPPATEAPSTEAPAGEAAESAAPTAETPATDTPADPPAEDANPLREAVEEEEEEEEAADASAAQDGADEAAAEPAAEPKVTYQPLEEVRDEVRRRLAESRAADKMRELVFGLKRELDDAYGEYFDAALDAADNEAAAPQPPAALADLAGLAERNGMEHKKLDLRSLIELRESDYGRSMDADPTSPQPLPLWITAFREGAIDLHEPHVTYDLDGNLYLSVVDERAERVTPKLDDVRDEVVRAWKRGKAADKALEAAKDLATKARDSELPIAGYLAEHPDAAATQSIETDPFSFLTVGDVSPTTGEVRLRLSQPEPLTAPGPELLSAAFALESGDIGVSLNHDRSVAYLLRVAARLESEDVLRARFLSEGDRWFGLISTVRSRINRTAKALEDELVSSAGLEWQRTPDDVK